LPDEGIHIGIPLLEQGITCSPNSIEETHMPYTDISNETLLQLIEEQPDLQIIDVRTPEEYAQHGHISGVPNLPIGTIEEWAETLNTEAPMAFLCKGGVRSIHACQYMEEYFNIDTDTTPLYNLEHGMSQWDGPLTYGDDD
jgi:rhodanese-related sulfurtransferase